MNNDQIRSFFLIWLGMVCFMPFYGQNEGKVFLSIPSEMDTCQWLPELGKDFSQNLNSYPYKKVKAFSRFIFETSQNCPETDSPEVLLAKAWFLYQQSDTTFAELSNRAFSLFQEQGNVEGMAKSRVLKGEYYFGKGDFETAKEEFELAWNHHQTAGNRGLALVIQLKLAQIADMVSQSGQNLELAYAGLDALEDTSGIAPESRPFFKARFQIMISKGLMEPATADESIRYGKLGAESATLAGDSTDAMRAWILVATVHSYQDQMDSAVFYYGLAETMADTSSISGKVAYSSLSFSLARLYADLDQPEKARKYALIHENLAKRYGGRYDQATALSLLGLVDQEVNPKRAEKYLLEAYQLFEGTQQYEWQKGVSQMLGKVYTRLGNTEKSIFYWDMAFSFKDSIYSQDMASAAENARIKFETGEKEKEVERQAAALAQADALTKAQNRIIWTTGIGLALVTLLSVIAAIAWFRIRKANQQLEEQKAQLEKQDQEKALLLREIHHRVKNNLQVVSSLLEWQSEDLKDAEAQAAFSKGRSRVRSMALIHEKLYQTEDLGQIDLENYIHQLTDIISQTYALPNSVQTTIEAGNIFLDIDTAVPLGLILNELISNAFKYALPKADAGKLDIKLERDAENALILEVSDNGLGLPEDFQRRKSQSMGMQLVEGLTRQLKGKLYIQNGSGAKFIIKFNETRFA